MKKIGLLLIVLILTLTGCGKESKEDILKDLKKNINNTKSYKVTGNMEISNDEETFTYSLESYYLKDSFYKVVLVNQTNNHEQIILKNKDDIYVITPALNKSFKFQSDWPDNSSQAYLLGSLIKDIENDKNVELQTKENGYVIKTKVDYPNNEDLKYQKIYLDNNKKFEKVEVYNESDIVKIKVTFDKIDLKANLREGNFDLKDYISQEKEVPDNEAADKPTEESKNTCSQDVASNDCNEPIQSETDSQAENSNKQNSENTANIENIIYPLYIPSNTFLTSSERVDSGNGNRIILTFSGDKNFVLIEEVSAMKNDMEIIPVYGEPFMLSESIGALSANSLSWDANNISYYLASTELTVTEMKAIANSLGNSTLVANTK